MDDEVFGDGSPAISEIKVDNQAGVEPNSGVALPGFPALIPI